jgi:O-methyltransferase involved in polyketide biosynthesis
MTNDTPGGEAAPPAIDTTVPHSARIWNYWLGGKDNYAVDRAAGDQFLATYPDIAVAARASRAFQRRAVRYLADEAGIRQFLDVGTGLPAAGSTHEVAQSVAPECRVVYVDNDPVVLLHAQALLTGSPQGKTDYLDADLRDPDTIVREAAKTLDFSQPVAVMLLAVLGHVTEDEEAQAIVYRLMDAVPSGSYLAIAHSTNVIYGAVSDEAVGRWNKFGKPPVTLRSPQEISRFFDGLDLLPPGLVSTTRWHPGHAGPSGEGREVDQFCGLARKP